MTKTKKKILKIPKIILQRGINGEYIQIDTDTGKQKQLYSSNNNEAKRKKAVLKTHSARQQKFEQFEAKRRNHSDETEKKVINPPVINYTPEGFTNEYATTLAPFESSLSDTDPAAQLYVEGVAANPLFKLAGRGLEYALAQFGNKWARGRIINRELNRAIDNAKLIHNSQLNTNNITYVPSSRSVSTISMKDAIDDAYRKIDEYIPAEIEAANAYGSSLQRKELWKNYLKEAKEMGYIDDESIFEMPVRNIQPPRIVKTRLKRGVRGKYDPETNTMTIDPMQADRNTIYHEALHYNKIGEYPRYEYNKKYLELLSKPVKSAEDIAQMNNIIRQHKYLQDFYKYKVDKLTCNDADEYFKQPWEFAVHTNESGRAINLKPFEKRGTRSDADIYRTLNAASEYNNYLYQINSNWRNYDDIWKSLTGNYIPATVGIAAGASLYNNK